MSSHDVCRICESTEDLEMILDGRDNISLWLLQSFISFRIEMNNRLPQCICLVCKHKLNEAFLFKWHYETTCKKYQTDTLKGHDSEKSIPQHTFSEAIWLPSLDDKDEKCNWYQQRSKPCDRKLCSKRSIQGGTLQQNICTGHEGDLKGQRKQEFSSNVPNDRICHESLTVLSKPKPVNKKFEESHKLRIEPTLYNGVDTPSLLRQHKPGHLNPALYQYKARQKSKRDDINVCKMTGGDRYIYKCDECDKRFVRLCSLKIHKNLHLNPICYDCDECGKSHQHLADLIAHKQWHLNPALYRCKFCGKAFARKESLKDHATVHTNPDLHKCNICNKTFASLAYLKQHKTWHLNPDLYNCDRCGKNFPGSKLLKRHKARHGIASKDSENNLIGNEVNVLSCPELAPITSAEAS